jgi:antitoxin component of RelBE/YafQ-DinJ toxin-antitoxin module
MAFIFKAVSKSKFLSIYQSRAEPELKADVEGIFKELGMSATEAINTAKKTA